MTDQFLLNAIRVGFCLMLFICIAGLITAASLYEAVWLSIMAAVIVYGLRALREF